jgi:hypothetical protein
MPAPLPCTLTYGHTNTGRGRLWLFSGGIQRLFARRFYCVELPAGCDFPLHKSSRLASSCRIGKAIASPSSQENQKGLGADGLFRLEHPYGILPKSRGNIHSQHPPPSALLLPPRPPSNALQVYSKDILGRFVARGYGSVLIPTIPGRYVRNIRMFTPVASTLIQSFLGWLTGTAPEFYDSKFVASSEGREVTAVQSTGM